VITHRIIAAAIFTCALSICAVAQSARAADSSAPSETQVGFFTPAVPKGTPRDGSCWTESIAVTRPGAWRCMIGNEIHDPCFQVRPLRGEVVCDADPSTKQAGFVLKLTKPLPETTPPSQSPEP